MTKGVIPILKFQTADNQPVIGIPIYSWFLELNNYMPDKNILAYYDKSEPRKFVIKSNVELLTNFTIAIAALVSLIWLLAVLI